MFTNLAIVCGPQLHINHQSTDGLLMFIGFIMVYHGLPTLGASLSQWPRPLRTLRPPAVFVAFVAAVHQSRGGAALGGAGPTPGLRRACRNGPSSAENTGGWPGNSDPTRQGYGVLDMKIGVPAKTRGSTFLKMRIEVLVSAKNWI